MVDEPNRPTDDAPASDAPSAEDPAGSAADMPVSPDGPDRPRSTGVALLVSGLLVWAGVAIVRNLGPGPGAPQHQAALDLPADLPSDEEARPESPAPLDAPEDAAVAAGADAQANKQADQQADEPILEEGLDTDPAIPEGLEAASPALAAPRIQLGPRDPNWAARYEHPRSVAYTVRHGGTLKRVANLYKIYHHEIEALNPGVALDKELGPGTKVVVYRGGEGGTPGESIDQPSRGRLKGAVPMPEGPGRVLKHIPWKGWATPEAVAVMDAVLTTWSELETGQPILVGNMSARDGGPLKPHQSHQSGRDIDLSYPQIRSPKEELNWREMTAKNLDRELTWRLLEILNDTGAVEVVYMDTKLQKLLYEWAIQTGRVPRADLAKWLEYPRKPGQAKRARVQHSRGHSDHMHVRFSCPRSHAKCR